MFKETGDGIVWLLFVLMFVLCSSRCELDGTFHFFEFVFLISSSSVQRQRRRADSDADKIAKMYADAAARENADTTEGASSCRLFARAHESVCIGESTHDASREADVQRCLDRLYTQTKWKRECRTLREGHCTCRVRAYHVLFWTRTFKKARQHLYEECQGFTQNFMTRYEGRMTLEVVCS